MKNKPSQLITKDGIKLSVQKWTVKEPVAELILIHGLGEYTRRYDWAADTFNDNNINVHSFDLRGHGNSEGERANVSSFDEYIEDVHLFVESLKLTSKNVFFLGHSLGGLIVTTYLTKYPNSNCNGLLLSGPILKVGEDTPPILVKLAPLVSYLFPKLKTSKIDPEYISRDKKSVKDYVNDPLIYDEGLKARIGGETIKSMLEVRKRYSSFRFPVLIMHGSADKIADSEGSQWMYDEISSEDKTLDILDGLYHEILQEPEKSEVIGKMIDWMKKRV